MPLESSDCEARIEECIEALDELIMSLEHLPPRSLAQALGIHLEGVLRALLASGDCSPREVKEFLREIERGAFS